jgi:hypothetical protein
MTCSAQRLLGITLGLSLWGCSEPPSTSAQPGAGGMLSGSGGNTGSGGVVNGAGGNGTTGGSSDTGGSPGSGGASGSGGVSQCGGNPTLSVMALTTTAIANMAPPFDSDQEDDVGPYNWQTNYGKPPEIIALASGNELDILWQDANGGRGFVVHVAQSGASFAVTQAYEVSLIDRIMGFARDEAGNYYVATGIDEDGDLTDTNPPPDVHRSGIVQIVKFDVNGCVLLEVDVGAARGQAGADEDIINPMVAASSRLAYAGGRLALVHGINTDPDMQGTRHQKALTTHIDAATGVAVRTESMWVSHSFDQRLFWDGQGFVELHLGDAFPRAIALGRFVEDDGTDTYELFDPKGPEGGNPTYTRLGGIAPAAAGDFGYLVAFVTDRSATVPADATIEGTRDLALIRVRRDFASMDPDNGGFIDESTSTQDVMSSGEAATNHLAWLTDYAGAANADRPRLVAIGGDQFVVLWERWTGTDNDEAFEGTYAMVIDAAGTTVAPAMRVSDHHISRGDDAVVLGNRALFVTGSGSPASLALNFVAADLTTEVVTLP